MPVETPKNVIALKEQKPRKLSRIKHPPAPKTLSSEGKLWWKRILSEYAIDDFAGRLLLQTCLEAHGRMREAQDLLTKEGLTVVDRYQQHKQHPAAAIERDQRAQMLAALKQLNLDILPLGKPGRPSTR